MEFKQVQQSTPLTLNCLCNQIISSILINTKVLAQKNMLNKNPSVYDDHIMYVTISKLCRNGFTLCK